MERIRAQDGAEMAVEVSGRPDRPAVLLLHSIGCDHGMWRDQVRALASGFRVVAPDSRGHGASEAPRGDYTLERLGRDALAVLDELGIARAHVCGLSLGGLVAQWLASHAPERVGRLVLANTAARIGTSQAWTQRAETVRREGLQAIADLAMGRFFSDPFRAASPEVVAAARDRLLATDAEGYAGCCAALRDADLSAQSGRIAAPTLLVAGRADVSTPADQMRALASAIPRSEFVELDAAHLSNLERPEDFNRALLRHLEAPDE